MVTLSLNAPEKHSFGSLTVSPDGRTLAFITIDGNGQSQLWVRPLHSAAAHPLAGSEDAAQPFWSADSQALGFFANGKLKKIDIAGGPPQTVSEAGDPSGGAWNEDGVIIFAPGSSGPLHSVRATTGETPRAVTQIALARGEEGHAWPHFLPDGRRFLYASRAWGTGQETYSVYAGSLDGAAPKQVLTTASHPFYLAAHGGYLLFVRDGLLFAQPFDAAGLATRGEPEAIGKIGFNFSATGAGGGVWPFSVSNNGILVFQSGNTGFTQMVWFDRTGKRLGTVDHPDFRYNVFISPEGNRVASERLDDSGNYDIWVTDLSRGTSSRLTNDPAPDGIPVWSPDGARIVFFSARTGQIQLHQMTADGGDAELLLKSKRPQFPSDWSRDGRSLLYTEDHPITGRDVWLHTLTGGSKEVPLVQRRFNQDHPRLSPDGEWIAYESDESGQDEIYVQPLTDAHGGPARDGLGRVQISTEGGAEARWRRDGRELYYLSRNGYITAVDVRTGPEGLQASVPHALFPVRAIGNHRYDVTSDGKRFLVNVRAQTAASNPATVMLNWTDALNGARSRNRFGRR
jgi:Tol biopolymer transport system component